MTEYQFVQLVKEMRRLQVEYKRTGNMRLYNSMGLKENEVDAAIIDFQLRREKKQPTQMNLPNLFNDETSNDE